MPMHMFMRVCLLLMSAHVRLCRMCPVAGHGLYGQFAQVLKIHTKDAFPKLLSYLGIPISSASPEMNLDGIDIIAVSSNFSLANFPVLNGASGLPPAVNPGVFLSADISWTSCEHQLCKAVGKVFGTGDQNKPGALSIA